MPKNSRLIIIGGAIFACLLWSTAFAFVKIGLQYVPPFLFAGLRFMASGLFLLPFCGKPGKILTAVRSNYPVILKVALFQTLLLYACFYSAMTMVSGSTAAIIIGASPLFSAVMAHVMMPGDRMSLSKTLSILGGVAGVVIISISRQPWSMSGLKEFAGIGLLILTSISSAVGNIFVSKDRGSGLNPMLLSSTQLFLGGLGLFILSLIFEGTPVLPGAPQFWGTLGWLSLLSSVAFSIWFILLGKPGVKVSELNMWKFILPVFGAILSWILLTDEHPSLLPIIGMICVSISVLFYFKATKGPLPKQETP